MDRNTPAWGEIDTINTPRSTWKRHWGHKTTFNTGVLFPILFDEDIIPGTTIKHKTSMVIRLTTPKYPTMDNLVFDWYAFRAPKFWFWEHFKNQFGENDQGQWNTNFIEYTTPQINVTTAYGPNDLATYMGVRQGVTGFKYDRLGINLYLSIWNNWFRSQALQAPITIDTGDNTLTSDGTINTGYGLLPVCRKMDPFSSALPQPSIAPGGNINMPLGTSAPIYGDGNMLALSRNATGIAGYIGTVVGTNASSNGALSVSDTQTTNVAVGTSVAHGSQTGSGAIGVVTKTTATGMNISSGIYADLTAATAATVNALRLAFATQRIFEMQARCGSIYKQSLLQYGVFASSLETLIPEYIGGSSQPINILTQTQSSGTTNTSPLGETGAYSVTAAVNVDFTKSFSTHDMLMIVGCVRVDQHTYQQGLPRQFSRVRRLDHYNPKLAFIGNLPIYNREIYLQADTVVNSDGKPVNDDVFGYREAWDEYIFKNSYTSGMMSSDYASSLDVWHFGDDYASLPVLGSTWIQEPITNVDRCLTVSSSVTNQFWADFWFEQVVTAPIPRNRTPGLIDHY